VRSLRSRGWIVLAFVAGLAGACSDAADPNLPADASAPADATMIDASLWYPGMTLDERPCPPDSYLRAHNFGDGFLAEYCRGCHGQDVPKPMRHGAPLDVNFDTLTEVRQHAARMYARAGDGYTTMPPAGGPGLAARALLGEWLACGAPE
jgi:cytochrome c5